MTRRTNQFFLFVFLFFLIMSTVFVPLMALLPISEMLLQFIVQCLIFIPILYIYIYTEKVPVKECFALRKISIRNAVLCVCIGLFVMPFMSLIVLLTSPLQPNLAEESMTSLQSSGLIPMLIVMAVQPAIFEELIFRGIALHGYRHRGARVALCMSAFLFAMLHMNLQQALYAFALGAIFAFLVQRTGSILASMLPHFVINASNAATLYFLNDTTTEAAAQTPTFLQQLVATALQCIIFLPLLLLCGFLFCYFNKKNPPLPADQPIAQPVDQPAGQSKEKLFTASIIIIIIIFVLFGILPNLYIFQK